MSKTAAIPTNVERWFPSKRYIPLIVKTTRCSLTYHQRLIYSYLVYRLRKDQTATKAKIIASLRVDKATVATALVALGELGLLSEDGRQYRAVEPNNIQKKWFASNRRTNVPWHRQFATYPVLRPVRSSRLSAKTNGLLWLLYSLAPKYGKPVVNCQHLTGLAVMLDMSLKGVSNGVARLENLGLVERTGETFRLRQPTAETLAFWEDRPVRQEKAFTLASIINLHLPNLDKDDPEARRKLDDLETINTMLDRNGLLMQEAGCPPGDIIACWEYVVSRMKLDDLWDFAVNFKEWFSCLLEEHRGNGYVGNPMTFLWLKVRERFPEHDPSDF